MSTNLNLWDTLATALNHVGTLIPGWDAFMIFIAEYTVWILLAVLIVTFLFGIRRTESVIGTASFLLAFGIGKGVGMLFSHTQPFDRLDGIRLLIDKEVNNAFPSDHTLLFFAYMGAWALMGRKGGVFALLFAGIVGVSRIAVGVHGPEDILVGAAIGLGAAFVMTRPVIRRGVSTFVSTVPRISSKRKKAA